MSDSIKQNELSKGDEGTRQKLSEEFVAGMRDMHDAPLRQYVGGSCGGQENLVIDNIFVQMQDKPKPPAQRVLTEEEWQQKQLHEGIAAGVRKTGNDGSFFDDLKDRREQNPNAPTDVDRLQQQRPEQ